MNLSNDDLKALVRDVVARHVGARPAPAAPAAGSVAATGPIVINASVDVRPESSLDAPPPTGVGGPAGDPGHASHLIVQIIGVEINEASCVIEPAVPCTHCGYCRSFGH